ncbi:hypothetical protein QFZ70_003059 [Arthrobacter sp. V1I9]|jgi:hypothetical protein|uniref:hypothetical protein n=1 Tax=Arthrobacter sp. V1I9 TaxID=3042275 RepID=UPI00279501F2|nr:hypothetical protein [Arthrobacter sp. V1I9]MDQ0870586.1 hypothetical protein [Arthrobacter sp. V1I9]
MTHADHLPDTVEEMLLDAGQVQDSELRAALLVLGSLASLPTPAPSGKLAALLTESEDGSAGNADDAGGISDSGPGDELAKRRRLRAHRPTVVGLALIAGMGLGVSGVAASAPVPGHSGPFIQHLLEDWAPAWTLLVTDALETVLPPDTLDGHVPDATVQGEPQPGVSEENATGGGLPAIAPAAEDRFDTLRVPEAPVPNTQGQPAHGNAEAQRGGGQGPASDSGKSDAGAAERESPGASAGLPEQAAAQAAGARRDSKHAAPAVPGARVDSGTEAIRQGADAAAGAAVKALPGTKSLQRLTPEPPR